MIWNWKGFCCVILVISTSSSVLVKSRGVNEDKELLHQKTGRKSFQDVTARSSQQNVSPAVRIPHKRSKRVKRIIGGAEVNKGKWPWLVSLQGKIPETLFFGIPTSYKYINCGASLINRQWILTAAHCFKENESQVRSLTPKYWHAKIGEVKAKNSMSDRIKNLIGKIINKSDWTYYYLHGTKIFIHPSYSKEDSFKNDIALMKLESSVSLHLPVENDDDEFSASSFLNFIPDSFNDFMGITKITTPPTAGNRQNSRVGIVSLVGKDDSFLNSNLNCYMKGWGCTTAGGQSNSAAHEVLMPVIDDSYCKKFWHVSIETRICAGSTNFTDMGICSGDSGGPLVCQKGSEWVQVGLASFSSKHKPGSVPGVFTRVSKYRDWIDSIINNN